MRGCLCITVCIYPFLLQMLVCQAYSLTNNLGLKSFNSPWKHGNLQYHGMTLIVDFMLRAG